MIQKNWNWSVQIKQSVGFLLTVVIEQRGKGDL